MNHRTLCRLSLASVVLTLVGCPTPPEAPTVPDDIFGPLGEAMPAASAEQLEDFEAGREIMGHRFTPSEGLGPEFNVTSCGACHERPTLGGSGPRYRDFLLVAQEFGDGSQSFRGKSGVQLQFSLGDPARVPTDPEANITAVRNAPPFFGAGLIAEIPSTEILRNADPDDRDGDGISGRPNTQNGFVGRFGRKAQFPSLENFIRGPLFNHGGITSDPLPNELRARLPVPSANTDVAPVSRALSTHGGMVRSVQLAQAGAPDVALEDDDGVPDPELSEEDLFNLVSFAMLLAAPEPDMPTDESELGRRLFAEAQCVGCHVPTLESERGLIPLYSDLLLHDMGAELSDGLQMEVALPSEFRTQPLWGVTATGPYLHDGRADTLDEAIRVHGGEAESSRLAYEALSEADRGLVITFLESLGGRSQRSDGLVPPGTPIAEVGSFGGPEMELDAGDASRFLLGRTLFDRDTGRGEGLGPRFNGDSCRSCHFEPIIDGQITVGGAGPADVDVTRQSIFDAGMGAATLPVAGSMAHRHTLEGGRPPIDGMSNHFETRQTPPIFGLGLIDRIDEAAIMAQADPDDLDGDGVSGRAHILADGRLGRLGWKAQVPSLQEFTRDAMSAEMGITLPEEPGQTFGALSDSDSIPDPEISVEELQALLFFMQQLSAPPRRSVDAALESMGETVFAEIGCASCHTPSLPLEDGSEAAAYTDVLLHDVAAADAGGVPDGDASYREFRTPPLWGVSQTGPYMHNGRAFSLEEAIGAHASEADMARQGYEALDGAGREALLAFLRSL